MKKLLTFSLAFMLAVLFNTNAIAQLSYDISPAFGSEVKQNEFTEIRITFPEVSSIEAVGTKSTPGAYCYMNTYINGNASTQYDFKDGEMYIEGNTLVIPITNSQVGDYSIYMSGGAIKGSNGQSSPSIGGMGSTTLILWPVLSHSNRLFRQMVRR